MEYDKIDIPQKFSFKIWSKLLPFFKPMKWRLLLIAALILISAGIETVIPLFNRYAVNTFILRETTEGILPFAILYLVVILAFGLVTVIYARQSMVVEMESGREMKKACFVHLQKLSLTYFNQTPVGYVLARVMSDTNNISGMVAWGFINFLWNICYIAGVLIAMLLLNVRLALIIMLIIPVIVIVTYFFKGRLLKVNREMRSINSKITGVYNEGITGAKTSKTLVIEDRNAEEFAGVTGNMYRASIRGTRLNAIFIPLVAFFGSCITAVVLHSGGYMVGEQLLELGTLSAFISYAFLIVDPVQQLAGFFSELIAAQANIERVSGLLSQEPEITDTPQVTEKYGDIFTPKKENWEKIRGDIEFKDVWFKYPDGDEYVLENFNLRIPEGTTIAIVGKTGAGKSTLVNLASRFLEPTRGKVLIDGRDVRDRSMLWLHSSLGYVLQNPHLFSGTIMENIRYGKLDATDEEVIRAAETVSAHKVALKLEKGYDTDVGEGGDRLSTGEKQLISFARAIVNSPPIFVLDEATSSIDTETEQLIQNAISHILEGRTSFIIAHRISTIRHADIILVVEDGKIVERGTHDELLKKSGRYHGLYTAMRLRGEGLA